MDLRFFKKTHPFLLLLAFLGLSFVGGGCAGTGWKRDVIYSNSGVILYREHREVDGNRVAFAHKHPVNLPVDKMVQILSQLVFEEHYLLKKARNLYVFNPKEIRALARPLTLGLREISPSERLRFLVTRSNWTDVFAGVTGTSGVVFCTEEGVLNMAFDWIQEGIIGGEGGDPSAVVFQIEPTEYEGAHPIIVAEGMKVHADPSSGKQFPRWIEITLAAVKLLPPPKPIQQIQPPPGLEEIVVPERPPLEDEAGAAGQEPKPAAGTAASPPAKPPAEDEHYQRLRARLETLKRLRSDGVLTEEEYQKAHEKTLSELSGK